MRCYNLSDQTRNNILRELLRTVFYIWKELLSHKISYEFRRVQMVMFLCPIWLKLTGSQDAISHLYFISPSIHIKT